VRLVLAIGALLLLVSGSSAFAQNGPGPSVAFGQVTAIPIPLQSVSGRFSSLNPLDRQDCPDSRASGRVVSPTLLLIPRSACGRRGQGYVLANVQLARPADAAQMVPGRRLDITARFKRALEARDSIFVADFVIAQNAVIVGAEPLDPAAAPAPAFTSYMICQPPELDALAGQLGSDLCVQNTVVADLAAVRPALEAAARAPAKGPPEEIASGAADAITCGLDPGVSDRHLTAIACARNGYWAWYKALRDPEFSEPAPP
jgi:hypothetical protein